MVFLIEQKSRNAVISTRCTRLVVVCAIFLTAFNGWSQGEPGRCVILGKVVDATTNSPLPFASVLLQGATSGTATDINGEYRLEGVPFGVNNVVVSFLGYTSKTVFEIETTPARPAVVNVGLSEAAIAVDAAEVVAESRATTEEAPLSVRSIGTNEIKRNPGGGRDISRALRSLPGWRVVVAGTDLKLALHAPKRLLLLKLLVASTLRQDFFFSAPHASRFASRQARRASVDAASLDIEHQPDSIHRVPPPRKTNPPDLLDLEIWP